ncbi:hypothetical protein ACFO1B_40725 [Dactylosporangium siamense]|uniref:Secreted protein n=1 Tax=Dactylosporangium siamense TaxID=685454 RepID=A0A919U8V5_9ACTN|nr:hypothetical protein [Dactylosporangium siamense]GIG42581.1 hypothetical protein Dsi01nite_006220 [Dactylosporangium siamense]
MRKAFVAAAVAALGSALLPATAAHASTHVTYYETAGSVIFVPACTPTPADPTCDPRGAGSWFSSTGPLSLTQGGAAVGSVSTYCLTTRKVGADYYGTCTDVLYTPAGTFEATGEINESALERFVPQQLPLTNGHTGTLTVQQVTYPDVFVLTVDAN